MSTESPTVKQRSVLNKHSPRGTKDASASKDNHDIENVISIVPEKAGAKTKRGSLV